MLLAAYQSMRQRQQDGAPDELATWAGPGGRRRHVGNPVCHLRPNGVCYGPSELRWHAQVADQARSKRFQLLLGCDSNWPQHPISKCALAAPKRQLDRHKLGRRHVLLHGVLSAPNQAKRA